MDENVKESATQSGEIEALKTCISLLIARTCETDEATTLFLKEAEDCLRLVSTRSREDAEAPIAQEWFPAELEGSLRALNGVSRLVTILRESGDGTRA